MFTGLMLPPQRPDISHPRASGINPPVLNGDATSIARGVGLLLDSCFY